MPSLELTQEEWQSLTVILTKQPWDIANPILYKMARQTAAAAQGLGPLEPPPEPRGLERNFPAEVVNKVRGGKGS